jgi:protein-arginine kinase activator protein McsA
MPKKLTQEEVLERFKKVHGNKYDYSKVIYKGTSTKVEIICPEHGSFFQKPNDHFNGAGCSNCAGNNKKNTFQIIKEFKKIHFNKYNYDLVDYIGTKKYVLIKCNKCLNTFKQTPNNHLMGNGCPNCNGKFNKSLEEIIKDFKKIHLNKYDYSKVNYKNNTTKVEIICSEHGSFWQEPYNHKNGHGCPKCSESKGERKVREFLESNNIKYSQEIKLFENYRFDFYLEDLNTVLEYDGKQHFEPVKYFGGLEGFLKTQERDKIKTEYCLKNNIRIIRIGYFEEVREVLKPLITGSN